MSGLDQGVGKPVISESYRKSNNEAKANEWKGSTRNKQHVPKASNLW